MTRMGASVVDGIRRVSGNLADLWRWRGKESWLSIIDNCFPHPYSGFRLAEFNGYLEAFPDVAVHTSGDSIPAIDPQGSLSAALQWYAEAYPQNCAKVFPYNPYRRMRAKLLYSIFVYNAYRAWRVAVSRKIPFVFGLYPGGGFLLNDEECDRRLQEILSSSFLAKVVVTQRTTLNYVLEKRWCSPDQVAYVFGVPSPLHGESVGGRIRPGTGKDHVDICFVAHKYTVDGRDKGFPLFLEMARSLMCRYSHVRCHIVGPFEPDTEADKTPGIVFYGSRPAHFFKDFYSRMDIIVSPNVPFVLHRGAFDGFPLTSCVEAALSGVVVCCCDQLRENDQFEDGKEILVVEPHVDDILDKMGQVVNDPVKLASISEAGKRKFEKVYSWEKQMQPRIRILTEAMNP